MEFNNQLVLSQWRLATERQLEEAVRKEGNPLDIKDDKLTSLLRGIESHVPHTSLACCHTLTLAVKRGWVEPSHLISALITATVTSSHPSHIIHALAQLLLSQLTLRSSEGGDMKCPYSLRTNAHPFISVYTVAPDNGLCLVDEALRVLTIHTTQTAVFMMEPFFKYILLHPSPSPQTRVVSLHLTNKLVCLVRQWLQPSQENKESACRETSMYLLKLLLRTIPLSACQSMTDLLSLISMVTQLTELVGVVTELGRLMIECCLDLIMECTNRGIPSLPLIHSLCSLVSQGSEFGSVSDTLTVSALLYHWLQVPPVVQALLSLCESVCSRCVISAYLLVLPLVQLLSQPWDKSADLVLSNQKTAAALLSRMQEHPLSVSVADVITERSCLAQLYLTLSISHETKWTPFLNYLQEYCLKDLSSLNYECLCIVLSALAVRSVRDVEGVRGMKGFGTLLSILTSIAQLHPSIGPSLLPTFIYLLSLTTNPHTKLSILHSIPNLATHKLTTSSVLNTLRVLGENPSLVSMATRLFGWTWNKQDTIFPLLLEYVRQPLPSVTMTIQREIQLSRVAVVRDVCRVRGVVHGEALLSLINKYMESHDSHVVSMAIDGLTELCRCDVVGVATVWGVVGDRLSKDSRCSVMVSVCGLISLASTVTDSDPHSHKLFKTAALGYLINAIHSNTPRVVSAALNTLAHFTLADLPATLLTPSHDMSHDVPVTGQQLVGLFQYIPKESFPDHAHFLSVILGQEVANIGRGTISTAFKQAQTSNQMDKLLSMLTTSLLQHSACCHGNWINIDISLTLSEMRTEEQVKGHGVNKSMLTEQVSVMEEVLMRSVRSEEEVLLRGVRSDVCEDLAVMEVAKSWKKFMKSLLTTLAQMFHKEQRLLSVGVASMEGVANEDSLKAHDWALSQILDKLEQFARDNPLAAGDVLIAFLGVVSSSISFLIGQSDHMTVVDESVAFGYLMEILELVTEYLSSTPHTPLTFHTPLIILLHKEMVRQRCEWVWPTLPVLVDVCIVLYVKGVGRGVESKLVELVENMCSSWNSVCKHPTGHILGVIGHVLWKLSPLFSEVREVTVRLVSDIAQNKSMESLCCVSALLPSLSVSRCGLLVDQFMTSLCDTLSTAHSDSLTSTQAKICSIGVAGCLVTSYASGYISDVMSTVTLLADLATKLPQESVYTLSLGGALHGLAELGHAQATSLTHTLATRWLEELVECMNTQEHSKVPPLLWGLGSLLGVGLPIMWGQVGGHDDHVKTLCPLVVQEFERVRSLFSGGELETNVVFLLAKIRQHVINNFNQLEKVPADYSYLPPSSLTPSLHRLMDGCYSDPKNSQLAMAVLECVSTCVYELPPCNWSRLVVPYVRSVLCEGCDGVDTLLSLCANKSTGFKQFVEYCTQPLIVSLLKTETLSALMESITRLAHSLPTLTFGTFLHTVLSSSHLTHSHPLLSLLRGVHAALLNTGLVEEKRRVLCVCVKRMYDKLVSLGWSVFSDVCRHALLEGKGLLWELSLCLYHSNGPKTPVLSTSSDQEVIDCCYASVVLCLLVMEGLLPFTSLESVLHWVLLNTEDVRIAPLFLVVLRVVSVCCCPSHANNIRHVITTLYTLLSWSRDNQVSTAQMSRILLLVHVTMTSRSYTDTLIGVFSLTNPLSTGTLLVLHSDWREPDSSSVKKKVCECLVEWLAGANDVLVRDAILGMVSKLKTCSEYQTPLIWTSIGHLL